MSTRRPAARSSPSRKRAILQEIRATDPAAFAGAVREVAGKLSDRYFRTRCREDAIFEAAGVKLNKEGKARAAVGRDILAADRALAELREAWKARRAEQDLWRRALAGDQAATARLKELGVLP
jgi:hypothetical protein